MLRKKKLAARVLLILLASFVLFCAAAEVYSLHPHNCCHTQSCRVCAAAVFVTGLISRFSGRAAAVPAAMLCFSLFAALCAVRAIHRNNVYSLYKIRLLI